jgi:hypothetical protein
MQGIWYHPLNDQRPAVLRWLKPLRKAFAHILDIGPGDAYYLEQLMPKSHTVVEPNSAFRQIALEKAAALGMNTRAFWNIKEMLCSRKPVVSDLVLMIHVLLYMKPEEIELLLPKIADKPLVMVYPWPEQAVSVQFEDAIGLDNSRERIALKQQRLSRPTARKVVHSHFRLPLDTSIDSLAYLVAHHTLDGISDNKKLDAAQSFVRQRIDRWRKPDWYEIPQFQVLESYNLATYSNDKGIT